MQDGNAIWCSQMIFRVMLMGLQYIKKFTEHIYHPTLVKNT